MLPPAVHINLLNCFLPNNHCLLSPFSENVYAVSAEQYLNFKFIALNDRKQLCLQTFGCSYDYDCSITDAKLQSKRHVP